MSHPSKRLHAELRAVLERHRTHTPTHRRAAHEALVPVTRLLNAALMHLVELEGELQIAEQAAPDLLAAPNIRWLHDEIAAVRHRGELVRTAFREFTQAYGNLERALTRPEAAILSDLGVEPSTDTPPVLTGGTSAP